MSVPVQWSVLSANELLITRDPFFFSWRYSPLGGLYFTALYRALASSLTRFHDHIQRRATVGRTPLNEWSVRRRDLYLTTHNTHNTQTSKIWVGFEPTIAADERPKTYALDRAATGTGTKQSLTQTNHTRWCVNTIWSPDDGHCDARNM